MEVTNPLVEMVGHEDPIAYKKAVLSGKVIPVSNEPKRNCPHCYGRGYVGVKESDGKPVICKCVQNKRKLNKMLNRVGLVW